MIKSDMIHSESLKLTHSLVCCGSDYVPDPIYIPYIYPIYIPFFEKIRLENGLELLDKIDENRPRRVFCSC